jgi:hypothetical protein
MNCGWLVWFMAPKAATVPVKALTLLGESSMVPLPIVLVGEQLAGTQREDGAPMARVTPAGVAVADKR